MLNARRVIAFCLLLGWLFAIGHVSLEHGAVANGDVHSEAVGHEDDHHDDGPEHDGGHHHDLTAPAAGQFAKAAEHKALAPVWLPLCDALIERLAAALRDSREPCLLPESVYSPPDGRASGWLLVVQTALPVRGPSLA